MSLTLNTVLDHSCNTTQINFFDSKNPENEMRRFLLGFQTQVGIKKDKRNCIFKPSFNKPEEFKSCQ